MAKRKKVEPDNKEQSERFIEIAKTLPDLDVEVFKETVTKIVSSKKIKPQHSKHK